MTAPKYLVIEAETLEARKHHRVLVEEALKNANLTAEQRAELSYELNQALMLEAAAQSADDIVEEEKERDKKSGEGEGGDEGNGGSQQGSSSGGSDSGGMKPDDGEETLIEDFELFELLFFIAADAELQHAAEEALAAATLVYDPNERTAHIHEPYNADYENVPHSPVDLLPSLERHAVTIGAHEICLRVHPDAVELFKNQFGYQPTGKVILRRGAAMQKMRKALTISQLPKNNMP